MKNKKIDNLFRNKLILHEVAPSANAWSKLEDKMTPKKSGYMVYWRVAAVLILLITSVFVLYDFNGGETIVATTEEKNPKESEVKDIENEIINNDSEIQLADTEYIEEKKKEAIEDIPKQVIKRSTTHLAVKRQIKKQQTIDFSTPKEQQELMADNGVVKEGVLTKEDALKLTEKIEDDKTVAVVKNAQGVQNKSYDFGPKVVITFKKDKVEKKEAIAGIKDDKNKKRKLFRKVLNFAKEIRAKNIGIASIREAKDELFTARSKKPNQQVNPK